MTAYQMGAASFSRELRNILTNSDQPELSARRLIIVNGHLLVVDGGWMAR